MAAAAMMTMRTRTMPSLKNKVGFRAGSGMLKWLQGRRTDVAKGIERGMARGRACGEKGLKIVNLEKETS